MLKIIKTLLEKIIGDIDAGNSNITEKEATKIVGVIKSYSDKTNKLSKYQACQYLNMSRATFDNYIRKGKLPKGKKETGFKELFWRVKDLDTFKKTIKNANNKNC